MFSVNSKTIPTIQVCEDVLKEKYLKEGESTSEDVFKRVARGLAGVEKPELRKEIEKEFFQNMKDGAVGAGRIMSAAGTSIKATLANCFVAPVGDSISGFDKDGMPGIYKALEMAAETMRMGGGVGYNFSNIRPKGAWIETTQSMASGPCSYMNVFDASCSTVESLGCFTGDTLISTTDGLIPIKNIVESDKEFFALTHLGPKKVISKFKNGVKPVFKVTTAFGFEVKVTKAHKFAQFEDGKIVTNSLKTIMNSDNKTCLILTPERKTENDKFEEYWKSYKLGKDLAFLATNSKTNSVSSIISNTESWVYKPAYLAGIIDEIGSIQKDCIKLKSFNQNFLKEVQIFLASFGVPSNYSSLECTICISGAEGLKRLKKEIYKFTAQVDYPEGSECHGFFGHKLSDVMAFDFSNKEATPEELIENDIYGSFNMPLSGLVESNCHSQFTNTVSDEIISITQLDEEETYDLEVEDVHLLSGNGIYTSNSRRGAQMGILDISHPDIEEFVKAKHQKGRWNNFNVSVGISNEFMEAVKNDSNWVLHHKAKPHPSFLGSEPRHMIQNGNWIYKVIRAKDLWDSIMKNTYDHAEPGIIFHDTANEENNLYYCETINATNPCVTADTWVHTSARPTPSPRSYRYSF